MLIFNIMKINIVTGEKAVEAIDNRDSETFREILNEGLGLYTLETRDKTPLQIVQNTLNTVRGDLDFKVLDAEETEWVEKVSRNLI